ncbi:MAG: metal-dependent hydrolase [Candidatus Hodarchaeales archaeon]
MPPTGFHGLIGLLIAVKINSKSGKVGFAWGSVFPDLDLLGSIFVYLLTQNRDYTIYMHRSVTHSLVIMALILFCGYFISLIWKQNFPNLLPFIIGLTAGMLLHSILDLFYLGGVALFWPLQPMSDRIIISDFTFEDLSPVLNDLLSKVIATLDGGFEAIYYLVLVHLAQKFNTDDELVLRFRSKIVTVTDWHKKLRLFAYSLIGITIIFLVIAFLSIYWPFMNLDTFVIILYIPLSVVYLLTGFLPLLMRNTVKKLSF